MNDKWKPVVQFWLCVFLIGATGSIIVVAYAVFEYLQVRT